MQEILKLVIGIAFLFLGIPIGNFLARVTKEELKDGKKWFNRIILICLIGCLIGLILRDDVLIFSLSFIAIVSSRSIKR